ncbi:MAG: MFS transporter [Puniceicoccales bacterium]
MEERNLRIGVIEGLLATPWVVLSVPAGFIISAMLTLYYGVSPVVYGLIASLPAWSNSLQIVLTPIVAKFLNARDMALSLPWLNLGLWAMLTAALGYLPEGDAKAAGQIFLIFFALASLSGSLGGVGWTAWVQQWTPTKVRGEYFGKRNRLISIVTVGFLLLSMAVLNWFGDSLWAYQTLIIIGLIGRFFSLLYQHLIETPNDESSRLVRVGWVREIHSLRHQKPLLLLIGFGAWCGFFMSLSGPFIPRFVYEHLAVAPWQFALVNILATLSGALTLPLWGKVIDRHGCVPAITISLLLWQAQNYVWCFLSPGNTWLLYPMWIWGGSVANGYLLGLFNFLYKVIPANARAAGISVNLAVTSLAAAVAPILAGQVIEFATENGWNVVMVYRIGFAVSFTALLFAPLIVRQIKEPDAEGEGTVMGAMRTVRQTLQIQGMNFLANASFVMPLRGRKKDGNSEKKN